MDHVRLCCFKTERGSLAKIGFCDNSGNPLCDPLPEAARSERESQSSVKHTLKKRGSECVGLKQPVLSARVAAQRRLPEAGGG